MKSIAKSSSELFDEDELKVLAELRKNSRENANAIAKRCGFSQQRTARIITRLEKSNMIWGYTVVYDEQKIGKTHFIMLIKRKSERLDEKTLEAIVSTETEDLANKFGITVETAAFIHGEYDWMITFSADNIAQAKQFSTKLMELYRTGTEKITIMQTLLFIRKNNVLNPGRTKLKDFL